MALASAQSPTAICNVGVYSPSVTAITYIERFIAKYDTGNELLITLY